MAAGVVADVEGGPAGGGPAVVVQAGVVFVDGQDRIQVADLDRPGPEVLREPTPAELERAHLLLSAWRAGLLAPISGPHASTSDESEAEAAERLRLLKHQGYAGG